MAAMWTFAMTEGFSEIELPFNDSRQFHVWVQLEVETV